MPYRSVLHRWARIPQRIEPAAPDKPTYRLLRYPLRAPLRPPDQLPILPAGDYVYDDPLYWVWSESVASSTGTVELLEPGQSRAAEFDSLWVDGAADASLVYFLPPDYIFPAGVLAADGYLRARGIGRVVDHRHGLSRVVVDRVASDLSVGHRVVSAQTDKTWKQGSRIRFPDRTLPVTSVIPLSRSKDRTEKRLVRSGAEVGLPLGAVDSMEPGQAWRLVQPGAVRFDPLRQNDVRYPDQTVAHILNLRVYDESAIAFILRGTVPLATTLRLEPVRP